MQARSRALALLGVAGAASVAVAIGFLSKRSPESLRVTEETQLIESAAVLPPTAIEALPVSAESTTATASPPPVPSEAVEPSAASELARGQYAFTQREYETCVQHLELAVIEDPTNFQAHYLLGLAQHRLNRLSESNAAFESALELAPRDPRALANSARTLLDLDRATDAHAKAQLAVEYAPAYADGWNVLGRTHLAQGRTAEAASAFERAIALDPMTAWAYNNLGWLHLQRGRWEDAAQQFEAAIERDDAVALFHHNLGAAYERCGRAADAGAQYARTLELQPDHAMARIGLTRVQGAVTVPQVATAEPPDSVLTK